MRDVRSPEESADRRHEGSVRLDAVLSPVPPGLSIYHSRYTQGSQERAVSGKLRDRNLNGEEEKKQRP